MAFQIKKFDSIVASMINWASGVTDKITDFNIGSVVRTIYEAVAIELEELYYQLLKAVEEAIEEAIYRAFNFPRNPSERSTGEVTFFRQGGLAGSPVEGDITVSAGVLVGTDEDPSILFQVQSTDHIVYLTGNATGGGTGFLIDTTVDFLALGVTVYESDSKPGSIVYCLDGVTDVLLGTTQIVPGFSAGVMAITKTTNPNDTLEFFKAGVGADLTLSASFAGPGARKYKVFNVWEDIPVKAVLAGLDGNVVANSVTVLKSSVSNVESCNNFSSFTDGKTDESDLERKGRFALYIQSLSRATRGALEYAALSVEEIVSAKAVDDVRPTVLVCDYDVIPVYIDISTEMRTPGDAGIALFPAIQAVNDALYFGSKETFEYLNIYLTTPGVIAVDSFAWEYYTEAGTWDALTVTDDTNKLTANGVVAFTPPADWISTTIDDLLRMWIRLRVTAAPPDVWTVVPLGDYCSVPPGLGYVWLYCHDGAGNLSASVKTQVENVVELYRACGVIVIVRAPYKTTPTVTCSITVAENYSLDEVEAEVRQAIVDFLNAKALGEDLYISELYQLIMDTNDNAIINCVITAPTKDLLVSSSSVVKVDSSLITITTAYGYSV